MPGFIFTSQMHPLITEAGLLLIARACLIEKPLCCVCPVTPQGGSAQVGVFWLVEGPWQYRSSLLQAMGRLPLPEKMGLLQGFGLFCAVLVLLGFLNLTSSDCPHVRGGGFTGKCYQQGYFPLCAFVDLFCSPALGTHSHQFLSLP